MMNLNEFKRYIQTLIKEAANEQFDVDYLKNLKTFKDKVNYCKLTLGSPIGNGSSRMVFQIDDNKVLKLSKNTKGLSQNDFEYDVFLSSSDILVPIVFYADDNDSFIISEFVLPAKKQDFPKCVGLTFEEFILFLRRADYERNGTRSYMPKMEYKQFIQLLENDEWFHEIYEAIGNLDLSVADLMSLRNLGLTVRDGKPQIVLLDCGLNPSIYDNFYSHK